MKRALLGLSTVLVLSYALLLIPEPGIEREELLSLSPRHEPFAWNQDDFWRQLQDQYAHARELGCSRLAPLLTTLTENFDRQLDALRAESLDPSGTAFTNLEQTIFEGAPAVAACSEWLQPFISRLESSRSLVKTHSQSWDMQDSLARRTLYRLLYGSRAALEEVMLQLPPDQVPTLTVGTDEPSATPWASILGVKIHSGDILVSRGGAPTSALIARGSDFPGNFSHIALVHVDPKTHLASILESHIERGVTVSTLEDYLNDTKLRVMVLRLRSDLPEILSDSMLPHRAATLAFEDAHSRHIPYDFEMNYEEHSKLFCSEVASAPYEKLGITLWMSRSSISTPGLRAWLGAFGVRSFITQEPSDLEYDPQLVVVAEWRDPMTLYKDHLDNAVIDVMLEQAEEGQELGYPWYLLPVARVAKGYSAVLNLFGGVGPVPEGMSAAAALRNSEFSHTHAAIIEKLEALAADFTATRGYRPPYWELVRLAREARQSF